MGTYLNPGNSGFEAIRNDTYVDKSGLVKIINDTIDTPRKLTCISRPRRFGKSFAAQMLCAYYDKTCDSSGLFDDLEIAQAENYKKYLNKYDVICIDMTGILEASDGDDMIAFLKRRLTKELLEAYPQVETEEDFIGTLNNAAEFIENKFIMIIDEWDAPIREVPQIQEQYLRFLRSLFKNTGLTSKVFAAVYMTGILPIKKDGSQSAISDFEEYTMLGPLHFSKYVGFTEQEVRRLCNENQRDFAAMKQWYDGYSFEDTGSVYNPNSVMKAVRNNRFRSYWTETSAAGSLMDFISRDEQGLGKTIAWLVGGIEVPVDTDGFANDLVTFKNQDDVLTLLIHLGYLAYDEETGMARIPNEEVRLEFSRAVREDKRPETMKRIQESEKLFYDTIHRNSDAVAAQIERVHIQETSPIYANNEQTLRSVIQLAYFSYKDHYLKFEELPAGKGYADVVYIPRKNSYMPVLIIELKWNKSAEGAISQIKDRKYPVALEQFGTDILLVGINYDKDAPVDQRKYTCVIEPYEA